MFVCFLCFVNSRSPFGGRDYGDESFCYDGFCPTSTRDNNIIKILKSIRDNNIILKS
jgi:hypothetical protein